MIFILQVQNNKLLFSTYFRIFPDLFLKFRKVGWNVNFFDFFHSLCQLKSSLIKQDYKEFPFSEKRKVRKFVRILWKTLADTLEMRDLLLNMLFRKRGYVPTFVPAILLSHTTLISATSSLCINGTRLGRAKKIHFLTKFRDKKVIKIPSLSLWPCSCQLGRDQSVSKWMITTVKSGIKIYRRG